jgi:hypothetical protein
MTDEKQLVDFIVDAARALCAELKKENRLAAYAIGCVEFGDDTPDCFFSVRVRLAKHPEDLSPPEADELVIYDEEVLE